jgi:hypothetical protein
MFVPSILDVVSGPARQEGCDADPLRAEFVVLGDDELVLGRRPRVLLMRLNQVVGVTMAALPRIPAGHVTGDRTPVVIAELHNQEAETIVLFARELSSNRISRSTVAGHSQAVEEL